MSNEAINLALSLDLPSSAKFCLVILANHADDKNITFPCGKTLCDGTSQNRKTVIKNINFLRDHGLIVDTGERCGATKQVIKYRLIGPFLGLFEQLNTPKNGPISDDNKPKNGPIEMPENGGNRPKNDHKQAQNRATEPLEPILKPKSKTTACKKNATATASRLPADWLPDDKCLSFCNITRPDLDAKAVADQFRDYWISQPGAKGRKMDWAATWRNWVRNQRAPQQSRAGPIGYESARDKRLREAHEILTGKKGNQNERNDNIIDITPTLDGFG